MRGRHIGALASSLLLLYAWLAPVAQLDSGVSAAGPADGPPSPSLIDRIVTASQPASGSDAHGFAERQIMDLSSVVGTPGRPTYGITVQLLGQPMDLLLNGVSSMRLGWIRQPVSWAEIEPAPAHYRWSDLDLAVDRVRNRGISLMVVIYGTPSWARPAGFDPARDGPPADTADLASFMAALVQRYGDAIDAVQVWQSPNAHRNWESLRADSTTGQRAAEYAQVLRVAHDTIKSISPEVLVVTAGLAPASRGGCLAAEDDLEFLKSLYQVGFSAWYDVMGVQLVIADQDRCNESLVGVSAPPSSRFSLFRHHEVIRRTMTEHADDKPVWLTQVGWPVAPDGSETGSVVGEQQQAQFLIDALWLAETASYIEVVLIDNFNLVTAAPQDPFVSHSLIRPDWSARPALVQLARARQQQALAAAGAPLASARNRAPQSGIKPHLRPQCGVRGIHDRG